MNTEDRGRLRMEECHICKGNPSLSLICSNQKCRTEFIKSMRGFSKEEAEAHSKLIDKLSKPTGRNLYKL